jgi:8-oxo-dGTP pyrophosphatase MutT (NUDIX family)
MSEKSSTQKTAGGVLYKIENDKVYLCLIYRQWDFKPDGAWLLPKGHIEENETSQIAAQREIGEETGYSEIELIKFIKKTSIEYKYKNEIIQKETEWFLFKLLGGQKIKSLTQGESSSEVFEIHWKEIGEAVNLITFDVEKEVVSLVIGMVMNFNYLRI